MSRLYLVLLVLLSSNGFAQQFRISEYDGETIVIEYPPSFAGAYLFVEQSSNLISDVVWETVDYTQVELVLGDTVYYALPATNDSSSTNETVVPYEITPEYIQAVSSGEIENSAWTAGSVWNATTDGVAGFFRILGLSFIDTDGDGIDNVSEYGAGTDYSIPDSPSVTLPPDNGDPRPVPGSVSSAPGDWNTPPQTDYRSYVGLHGAINARIMAMNGTNGTFSSDSTVEELGEWIESVCGSWMTDTNTGAPVVEGGRFYQPEVNGFTWDGRENMHPIAFHSYDGTEGFTNHLVQANSGDWSGLARLPDNSPVLLDASNPWTEDKIRACLVHLITLPCNLQRVIYESGKTSFDESDTTAMAQASYEVEEWYGPRTGLTANIYSYNPTYEQVYSYSSPGSPLIWDGPYLSTNRVDICLTFLSNLEEVGFGQAFYSGYIRQRPSYDWVGPFLYWDKYDFQPIFSGLTQTNVIYKTFTCAAGETGRVLGGNEDLASYPFPPSSAAPPPTHAQGNVSWAEHKVGVETDFFEVLATINPSVFDVATLIADFDRDGTIGTNDLDRFDQSHPFRFWVNEDGNSAAYPEADLEDFFPVQINWREGEGMSNLTFKLSANVDLDYVETAMTTNDTDAYLTDLAVAAALAGSIQTLATGTQTGNAYPEDTILLLAPSAASTNAQIYVHILQNGSEIAVATNYFSFSPVEEMYRTKNLRASGTSTTEEPSNWPDDLTNGKDFVFIHGYNVDEPAGHEWNKTIFKRLWHSGSNAKFNGILWDGTPAGSWTGLGPYHYHNAVINAFATAPELATYLNGLNEPVVAAHSLGNMVTSEAIAGDHGLPSHKVTQYYALDAAVALEAYGDVAPTSTMVSDNLFDRMDTGLFSDLIPIIPDFNEYEWEDYPYLAWSSEWYQLFTNNVNDARGKLTWRHRFLDIQDRTDVFNFYSSSEDVLRIDEGFVSFISAASKKYVWQIQEHFKGRLNTSFLTGIYDGLGGAASEYCGWGFVDDEPTDHIHGIGSFEFAPVRPRRLHEKLALENPDRNQELAKLATDPLFKHEPAYLFGAAGDLFAGGTVFSHGSYLDYNTLNATYPIGDVQIKDWLLAKAFPSRTRPMGSTQNSNWDEDVNLDMSDSTEGFMTNPQTWIRLDKYNGIFEWRHSDIKDAPYVYIHKLYGKITGKEN